MLVYIDMLMDFWESMFFQVGKYKGDMIEVYLEVYYEYRLNVIYFSKWLEIFNGMVNDLFEGVIVI